MAKENGYKFSLDANFLFIAIILTIITIGLFAMFVSGRMGVLQGRIGALEIERFSERVAVLEEKVGWLEDQELAQEKFRTDEYHRLIKGDE